MNIKNRVRADRHTCHIEDHCGKRRFVIPLDPPPFLPETSIIRIGDKFFKLEKVCYPLIAYTGAYQAGELPVDLPQPDPLAYTIGLICKFARVEIMEIPEYIFFQNLCMYLCNPIDLVAPDYGKISHPDPLIAGLIYHGHPFHAVCITGAAVVDI